MQISNINSNQAFKARSRKDNENERFFNQFSDMLDTTSKRTGQLADFVVAAKSAIDSPEELTVRVVNDKLDDIATSEKTPKWIKKPLTYVSAALVTGLTYLAATKCLKTPGIAIKWTKKQLGKSNIGNSVLNFAATIKEKTVKLAEALHIKDNKTFKNVAKFLTDKKDAAKLYIIKRMPKLAEKLSQLKTAIKLDKWSKKDYFRNGLAAFIGLSSGCKYVNKHSQNNTKPAVDDAELNIQEAA